MNALPQDSPRSRSSHNYLRRLYDWVLRWADTPYGTMALAVLAFAESSFFPIPPDVLLIALALAAPTRAFRFALLCTLASVAGGVFGYYIGYAAWVNLEPYFLDRVFSRQDFEGVTQTYRTHGGLAVFTAAFTPIPYKVFTIAAGVAEVDFGDFVLASILGRGGRFFLVAAIIRATGQRARILIDRYFNLATILATLLLIGGFALIKWLR